MILYVLFAVLLLGLGWLLWGGRGDAPEPTAGRRAGADIDYGELERAERDVQQAADEESVRDWGPGTERHRASASDARPGIP